eukprot:5004469-Pleurochrysis_carterae.AAC.7
MKKIFVASVYRNSILDDDQRLATALHAASMAGSSETPVLFPLIASFVAQHTTRLMRELQDAAVLDLAQHLERAACNQAGYDLQQAAALADGCWSALERASAPPPDACIIYW